MRPDHLLNIPCTIHAVSDGAVDEYGDPTVTTTDIEAVCWVDRRGGAGDMGRSVFAGPITRRHQPFRSCDHEI